ncbi:Rz-like lysis system protein LysB [Pseudomonas sp. SA3-5]|uniref:Rz-like lysis system protein LysB n=1 Tax=Pseudomonas aestuarii TaxID=3018340 RepID=A0ABT4XE67_9PSED|nr:Rz-like lysis system protein LysB [Pseudomonas aestuarii]MDA7086501.1 Rz-like lysis system protein LysB [Pseudomonas aestuarii]
MTTLHRALYGIALLAALAWAVWIQTLRLDAAEARADQAISLLEQSKAQTRQIAAHANRLAAELGKERTAQASLRSTQNLLRQGLSDRETQIEGLKRENSDLRRWASQPLPDAARRLRQRPAITGAAAYRDWLSRSGALRPAGDQPGH